MSGRAGSSSPLPLDPNERFENAYAEAMALLTRLDEIRGELAQVCADLRREHDRVAHRPDGAALLVTAAEAARLMACSVNEIYVLTARGILPKYTLGNRGIRIPLAALEAHVAERCEQDTPRGRAVS